MATNRPGKIEQELTAEQLADFCARLSREKAVTGTRIAELAGEWFGISVSKNAGYTFKAKTLDEYTARLRNRGLLAKHLRDHSDPDAAATLADVASGELTQSLFEFVTSDELSIDFTTPEGLAAADLISKIISRARTGDHRLRLLEAKLTELTEQREADKAAVDAATRETLKTKGASLEARNALRMELGLEALTE